MNKRKIPALLISFISAVMYLILKHNCLDDEASHLPAETGSETKSIHNSADGAQL